MDGRTDTDQYGGVAGRERWRRRWCIRFTIYLSLSLFIIFLTYYGFERKCFENFIKTWPTIEFIYLGAGYRWDYTVILSKDNRNKSSPAKNSTHKTKSCVTHARIFLFPWKKIIDKNPIRPGFFFDSFVVTRAKFDWFQIPLTSHALGYFSCFNLWTTTHTTAQRGFRHDLTGQRAAD